MTASEFFLLAIGLSMLATVGAGLHGGVFQPRRRRHLGPWELLGAEVERLNKGKKKNNP